MLEDVFIYVDNIRGKDNKPGTQNNPLETADEAFRRLPTSWHKRAEIIFSPTGIDYPLVTDAVYFGAPIGPEASSLIIRGGYVERIRVTATGGTRDEIALASGLDISADDLVGKVVTRLSPAGDPVGPAVLIRGNSEARAATGWSILLQRSLEAPARSGEIFSIQQPAVKLVPNPLRGGAAPAPGQALTLTSHDGCSPNLRLIGLEIAPVGGVGLNLINVRAMCDTCEFYLRRYVPPPPARPIAATLYVHTNARLQGGSEVATEVRAQAGVYIHSDHLTNAVWAVRAGVLAGHLTFQNITIRASQGGVFVPKSLEALNAPVRIMTGGSAFAEAGGWGTFANKGRIRKVTGTDSDGDGLRVSNGGSINSPLAPIHLDIFGCERDGIHLDSGSSASFGPPAGECGLVTSGAQNVRFGMNIRNASRALIGSDAANAQVQTPGGTRRIAPLRGNGGEVALDDGNPILRWTQIVPGEPPATTRPPGVPQANAGHSLVRLNI